VLAALARIDRKGIPPSRANRSVKLRHNQKRYPLKVVISVACELVTGHQLSSSEFITMEAERYFQRLGFSVARMSQQSYASDKKADHSVPALVVSNQSSKELGELARRLIYPSRLYRWSELRNSTLLPRSPSVHAFGATPIMPVARHVWQLIFNSFAVAFFVKSLCRRCAVKPQYLILNVGLSSGRVLRRS